MSEINLLSGVGIAASGLSAQRTRLDVIARNIANASSTNGPEADPYRRQLVQLVAAADPNAPVESVTVSLPLLATDPEHRTLTGGVDLPVTTETGGVATVDVVSDDSPFQVIYDPTHPDADEQGLVRMPNVDVLTEMVDLMLASRAYQANLAVLEASRETAQQTLDLMR